MSSSDSRALVDPELLPFLDNFPLRFDGPASLTSARQVLEDLAKAGESPPPEGVERLEALAPGLHDGPNVPLILHRPLGKQTLRPILLFVHGGAMFMGGPEGSNARLGDFAQQHGCVVVAPAYRKAPESPWPSAVIDCYAALEWIVSGGGRSVGVEPTTVTVYGESAGGGLAAALAIYARDQGSNGISTLGLSGAMLDDRTGADGPDKGPYGKVVWSASQNQAAWNFVKSEGYSVSECPIPGWVEDLHGLPRTFMIVGQLDLFFRENVRFAERLADAGVLVELHVYPAAFHSFEMAQNAEVSEAAIAEIDRFVGKSFAAWKASQ